MYAFIESFVHVYENEGNRGDLALFKFDLPCSLTKQEPWLPIVLKDEFFFCLSLNSQGSAAVLSKFHIISISQHHRIMKSFDLEDTLKLILF